MTNGVYEQRKQLRDEMRERRKQQLRDDILNATHSLLEQKGFAAMVMEDVAALAGISKPTLYSYFAAKDELVAATVAREINRQLQLTELDEASITPIERLARFLETIVQLQLRDQREPVRLWMPEIHRLSYDNRELMQAIQNLDTRLSDLVREGIAAGEIDAALDPATVVRSFYALVTAICFTPHSSIGNPDPARAAHSLATIFRRGVQSEGTRP